MADLAARFWSKVDRRGPDECWEWNAHRDRFGYGRFGIGIVGAKRMVLAHRLAWDLVNGPTSLHVLHHCDNPPCVNPAHLFLGSQADNLRDMREKGRGRARSGETHPRAKLTEDAVRIIRSSPATSDALAADLGVTVRTINLVRSRARWREVA